MEGFAAGVSRETILADAAERYAARWGRDKITHVNVAVDEIVATRPHRSAPVGHEPSLAGAP